MLVGINLNLKGKSMREFWTGRKEYSKNINVMSYHMPLWQVSENYFSQDPINAQIHSHWHNKKIYISLWIDEWDLINWQHRHTPFPQNWFLQSLILLPILLLNFIKTYCFNPIKLRNYLIKIKILQKLSFIDLK